MRVLVACEYSGRVREAFRARGHEAWSVDLEPSDDNSPYHVQGDMWAHLLQGWDLVIAHPPCTYHANSGVRWFTTPGKAGTLTGAARWQAWGEAVVMFKRLQQLPELGLCARLCIENPVMHGHSRAMVGPPTQLIQPWQFGHQETKRTGLWLVGLPPLEPTDVVGPPATADERKTFAVVHRAPPGPERWKARSRTYDGIAKAMAAQWG